MQKWTIMFIILCSNKSRRAVATLIIKLYQDHLSKCFCLRVSGKHTKKIINNNSDRKIGTKNFVLFYISFKRKREKVIKGKLCNSLLNNLMTQQVLNNIDYKILNILL